LAKDCAKIGGADDSRLERRAHNPKVKGSGLIGQIQSLLNVEPPVGRGTDDCPPWISFNRGGINPSDPTCYIN